MIISPSHTLEYKPNDITITSSIGDVLLHHPNIVIYVILTTRLHLQIFGRWSLGILILTLALLRLHTAPAPRNAV